MIRSDLIENIKILGVAEAVILASVLYKKLYPKSVNQIIEPEKTFGNIPLSKFNDLAKEIYHGIGCTIDDSGFLVFHCGSKRGHQLNHTQMTLNNGKLKNLGGHYPGEQWSLEDEFVKRANELFFTT